ncbi:flagellar hook-basal body complex protein FliE [Bacillus sp. AGMB 02131]|uniref:Flagellar hook-basal body complex protein FliE n=1 Tax=Peribacillus faecalis TaxID=2772559 RepID=A0A927HDH7_9BACI|nr:flagellar hook-basal body complex protein FliE [Peribacillus faecalis]MBD3109448.1 flagellar hook-basal body complex protein FliE [Peribacillus faecalis]
MWVSGITSGSEASTISAAGTKQIATTAEAHKKFSSFLKDSIEQVNAAQLQSDAVTEKLVRGENVDLHTVMITSQKASVMMQTTLEMRNKAVEAYQEIMRMQV